MSVSKPRGLPMAAASVIAMLGALAPLHAANAEPAPAFRDLYAQVQTEAPRLSEERWADFLRAERDHRADGGAFADMAVRHHRNMVKDDGQFGNIDDLLQSHRKSGLDATITAVQPPGRVPPFSVF